MYTNSAIADSTFGVETYRPHVKFSHTDGTGDDFWIVECAACGGNGYDIETDGFSVCTECDDMGEYGPLTDVEVREFFA